MPNDSFFDPLERLIEGRDGRRVRLKTIIEHRHDEEVPIAGHVDYEGSHGWDGFAIGWSHNSMNRTTLFTRHSWKLMRHNDHLFFLIRTAPDEGDNDIPWKTANLYTLILVDRT